LARGWTIKAQSKESHLRRWAVAKIRSGREAEVCEELGDALSVEAYCPMFVRWRKLPKHLAKSRGKTKELVRSVLFPSYIFVRIEDLRQLSSIAALRDVFGFVSSGLETCFADDRDIQTLKSQEVLGRNDDTMQGKRLRDSERLDLMIKQTQSLGMTDWLGKKVYVKDGPFKDATGVVERVGAEDGTVEFGIGALKLKMSYSDVLLA
jgi:transcription antitermination factor NusG